jgi:hypothetical protein
MLRLAASEDERSKASRFDLSARESRLRQQVEQCIPISLQSYAIEVVMSRFSYHYNCCPDATKLLSDTHLFS